MSEIAYLPAPMRRLLGDSLSPSPEARARLTARLAEARERIAALEIERADLAVRAADDPAAYVEFTSAADALTRARDEAEALAAGLRRLDQLEQRQRDKAAKAERRKAAEAMQTIAAEAGGAATAYSASIAATLAAYRRLVALRARMAEAAPQGAEIDPAVMLLTKHGVDLAATVEAQRIACVPIAPSAARSAPEPGLPFLPRPAVQFIGQPDKLPSLASALASADAHIREVLNGSADHE